MVLSHGIAPQYKTQLSITHIVDNKITISFNLSILKKLKSRESCLIHKSVINIASFAECTFYLHNHKTF